MSATNGTSRLVRIASTEGTATCPLCQSPLTEDLYESIVKIDAARQRQLADERAAIEHEREEVAQEREKIAADAIVVERVKWEAVAVKTEREAERARKQAEADRERLARQHERELAGEVKKREASEKKLARELAAAQAKAKAEGEARVREARRAVAAEVVELRTALKTSEQRRRRDEETMKQSLAEIQRKAEDRDRAHFGPEGEEDLVKVLRDQFPGDKIEHRGKGGDVLMTVVDAGRPAGKIIFEVKNTKTFQREYVRQTKEAMAMHSTKFGMLVSRALPTGKTGLCSFGDVLVAVPAIATQVVAVLRESIITISRLRLSEDGKSEKMVALFDYLRGDDFRAAVQRVQEKIVELRESLTREKSHHDGWWSARENHYATILRAAAGIDARVNDLLGGEGPRVKPLWPEHEQAQLPAHLPERSVSSRSK